MGLYSKAFSKIGVVISNISAPRWIVFLIDTGFSIIASAFAFILTIGLLSGLALKALMVASAIVVFVRCLSFIVFKTYCGIVRHTGSKDYLNIFRTLTIGEIALIGIALTIASIAPSWRIPMPFLFMEYAFLLCLIVFSRLVFKALYASSFGVYMEKRNVVLYGDEEYVLMLKHVLSNSDAIHYNVVAFVNTNSRNKGKLLSGIRVYNADELPDFIATHKIDSIIIEPKTIDVEQKKNFIKTCMEMGVSVREAPNLERIISGRITESNLRNIRIEELLERDTIEMDEGPLSEQIRGKKVLVSGAAGSIGSEIVRQLTRFEPGQIILLDIAESALYDIELELQEKMGFRDFSVELADIRNREQIRSIFEHYRPEIVYHAAAYKHVPMIERLPLEGVKTNILGSRNMADMAHEYGCEKFVMVSTDKAVNPTNVMGCSKRIAEIYIQSLNGESDTAFVTTRFGNVLGSNGSVIPRFVRQIEEGGPVTVTHPDITRFFMTIPEACQLVLQAGALGGGGGGEIFVFDMGKSVRIADLARNMIRLSGHEVDKEIKIVYTGLRPGEKLYEEMLSDKEVVIPTPHKRIHRARVREYDFPKVCLHMDMISGVVKVQDVYETIKLMKVMVPEFRSNNSVYEKIDVELDIQRKALHDNDGHGIRKTAYA